MSACEPITDGVVGVVFGKQLMEQRLFDDAVGLVLDALAPFVADDVLLVVERAARSTMSSR